MWPSSKKQTDFEQPSLLLVRKQIVFLGEYFRGIACFMLVVHAQSAELFFPIKTKPRKNGEKKSMVVNWELLEKRAFFYQMKMD